MRGATLSSAILLGAVAGIGIGSRVEADPILAVDFQGNSAVSPSLESSFQAFDDAQDGHSAGFAYGGGYQSNTYTAGGVSSGTITIGLATVAGAKFDNQLWNDRDRAGSAGTDNGTYANSNLYRDFIFVQNGNYATTGAVNGLDIVISGLNGDAEFSRIDL